MEKVESINDTEIFELIRIDTKTGKRYVALEDFNELHLQEERKERLEQLMRECDILLLPKKRFATYSRHIPVSFYEYGEKQALGIESLELPKFATLEYDFAGNVILEDYSELDLFLEETFIPKYIRYRFDKWQEERTPYISLFHLIDLGLNELEIKHVFSYLDSQGVKVAGENSSFTGEFPNYVQCLNKTRSNSGVEAVNSEEIPNLLREYQLTKDLELREKLILMNRFLVDRVATSYSRISLIPKEEVESYCWEALIRAVDSFDVNRKVKFSHYANKCIKSILFKKLPSQEGFKFHKNLYYKYINVRSNLLDEDPFVDDIEKEVIKTFENTEDDSVNLLKAILAVKFPENFDELDEMELVDDYTLEQEASISTLSSIIDEVLETCSDTQKEMIRGFYGFDGTTKMLKECGEFDNITIQRISQKKEIVLDKFRTPTYVKKLKDYL